MIIKQEDDAQTHIYERSTDSRIRDRWVEAVAKNLSAHVEFARAVAPFTKIARFLIVRLDKSRLVRNGDKEQRFTTFTFDGKQFEPGEQHARLHAAEPAAACF